MCNYQFLGTVELLSKDTEILKKIKDNFEQLSNLLVTQEEWLAPFLLAIAHNNLEMGDWFISKFLSSTKSKQQAEMTTDIICHSTNHACQRLSKMISIILA